MGLSHLFSCVITCPTQEKLKAPNFQEKTGEDEKLDNPPLIELLPTELLLMILEMLPPKDQKIDLLVCRLWKRLLGDILMIKKIKEAIPLAIGDLYNHVSPNLTLMNDVANKIFSLAKINFPSALEELNKVLARLHDKPPSTQNHIIFVLIEAWHKQNQEQIFLELLKSLYQHTRCNQTNRLHIASLSTKGGLLEKFQAQIFTWNPALKGSVREGKLLESDNHFQRRYLETELFSSLIISQQNTFQKREIVAIDHKGSLIGPRKKLWYGVVREIREKNGILQYRVYGQYVRDTQTWIDGAWLTAGMIGKISKEHLKSSFQNENL
jgi:hypothetical protein